MKKAFKFLTIIIFINNLAIFAVQAEELQFGHGSYRSTLKNPTFDEIKKGLWTHGVVKYEENNKETLPLELMVGIIKYQLSSSITGVNRSK